MATGILSVAADKLHFRWTSEAFDIVACFGLVVLIGLVVVTRAPRRWDLKDPDVTLRLFTFVAACAVLDNRMAAIGAVLASLSAVVLVSWTVLAVLTARNMSGESWTALRDRARGVWELGSVGTSALVIVAAQVAAHTSEHWWWVGALAVWIVGLAVYGLMTWLILRRAAAEGTGGFQPDSWILMGGLAIAAVAGDKLHGLAAPWLRPVVQAVTVLTWAAATLWIPPLIYLVLRSLIRRPALRRFAGVWWAMVFPLGMYSVATTAVAGEIGRPELHIVALAFFWIAAATWLVMVLAGLQQAGTVVRADRGGG